MHFYIRTLSPSTPDIRIPPPVTVPLLQVCNYLQLPPVLTYSDDVLYNWALKTPEPLSPAPSLDNLRCLTLFTGTHDEEEFYLSSARIELRGVLDRFQVRFVVSGIEFGPNPRILVA